MPSPLELLFTPLGWALRKRRSGEKHSVLSRPGWNPEPTTGAQIIHVRSDAFASGQAIPDRHSAHGRGDNLSPHLSWTGVPREAEQLILVFEDLDFPFDRPGLHSIGVLPAHITGLEEGSMTTDHDEVRWVPTHDGTRTGYAGPRPLPGHGRHRYRFHVIALDHPIDSTAELPDINVLDSWVSGHVIARGTLEGHQDG